MMAASARKCFKTTWFHINNVKEFGQILETKNLVLNILLVLVEHASCEQYL